MLLEHLCVQNSIACTHLFELAVIQFQYILVGESTSTHTHTHIRIHGRVSKGTHTHVHIAHCRQREKPLCECIEGARTYSCDHLLLLLYVPGPVILHFSNRERARITTLTTFLLQRRLLLFVKFCRLTNEHTHNTQTQSFDLL